jgi:hypothetical protein
VFSVDDLNGGVKNSVFAAPIEATTDKLIGYAHGPHEHSHLAPNHEDLFRIGKEIMASVRMDKWLWAARFFKTRALAARACELGQDSIQRAARQG